MPWILADYTSLSLDLDNARSFHDLRVPINASTQECLDSLRDRRDSAFDDDSRYLYGSLYASAVVLIGDMICLKLFKSLHPPERTFRRP
jgi:hypothetical protein